MKLSVIALTKKYERVLALDQATFEAPDSRITVLLGPSGSGKSTALRLIAGLERPDSGVILFDDEPVNLPPEKRGVSMVFQSFSLFPHMSVKQNILFGVRSKNLSQAQKEAIAKEIAELVGVTDKLDAKPDELSGGQQQRVALARALIKKPALFLLDEPLSNLDAQLRFSARKFVKSVQKEFGITTIYVTHDQSEALSISDRIAVMNRGVVLQVGSPREVYENPKDEFVASFLGSPPLNLIEMQPDGEKTKPITLPFPLPKGKKITVGIRPESIVLGSGPNRARVSAVEYAGRESVVYLDLDGVELRCLSQKEVSVGAEVCFEVVKRGVFLFEENGTSIPWPQ